MEQSMTRCSDFLHELAGVPSPARNDCGYIGRYEYEDTSRMFGWGPEEGEGVCDYPDLCPMWGRCPLEVKGG
jgi:hypothetical protein